MSPNGASGISGFGAQCTVVSRLVGWCSTRRALESVCSEVGDVGTPSSRDNRCDHVDHDKRDETSDPSTTKCNDPVSLRVDARDARQIARPRANHQRGTDNARAARRVEARVRATLV